MKHPSYALFIEQLLRGLRSDIMTYYGAIDHDLKEDFTVVTALDKEIEHKLVAGLREHTPTIGIYGEELGKSGSTDTYWLIDPIDGTESYVRGLPGAMSIIGLVEDGECTQSYIYDPVHDDFYVAIKDAGAFVNGNQLAVSTRSVDRAIIAMGSRLAYQEPELFVALKQAGVFHLSQYFGSAAKAVYLATGKIEGIVLYKQGGGLWDLLPTRLLAIEAGAVFTSYDTAGELTRSYSLLTPIVQPIVEPVLKELL